MTFQVDDSNPGNPLEFKSPQDFGMDSWLDLFIYYSDCIKSDEFFTTVAPDKLEFLRAVVQSILAHLVDNLTPKREEGGEALN